MDPSREVRMSGSKNKINAWKHFWPDGEGRAKKGYVLHHIDPTWKTDNPQRYDEWNIEDLVMITNTEHQHIHHVGAQRSEETKKKISESNKGKTRTEETRMRLSKAHLGHRQTDESKIKISESLIGHVSYWKGKQLSDETKKKMSKSRLGRRWWNNGYEQKFCRECPDGFVAGQLKR